MWWTSLLSFLKVRWKAMLVLCGAIGIGLLIWYNQSVLKDWGAAIAEREQLVQTVEQQNEQIERLLEETKRNRELIKKRNENIKQIHKTITEIPYEIKETIREDQEAADWADDRIPPAVIRSLRGQNSSDKNENQTNGSARGNGTED